MLYSFKYSLTMSGATLLRTCGNRFLPMLYQSHPACIYTSKIKSKTDVSRSSTCTSFLYRRLHVTKCLDQDIFYSKSHEWIKVEGDTGTIGITDYAQDKLGEIVYCELPEIDDSLEKDDPLAIVESVKAASDVFMPVSGIIKDRNEELSTSPGLINDSPLQAGWLVKVKLSDPSQTDDLLKEEDYKAFVREQGE